MRLTLCSIVFVGLGSMTGEVNGKLRSGSCPPSIGFTSFSGKPATQVADCSWDYFACTNSNSEECCRRRFDNCCKYIMDPENYVPDDGPVAPQTLVEVEVATEPPYQHPDTLIECIWTFFGCSEAKQVPEERCRQRFEECKMIVMGMPIGGSQTQDQDTRRASSPHVPITSFVQYPVQRVPASTFQHVNQYPKPSFGHQRRTYVVPQVVQRVPARYFLPGHKAPYY